MGPRLASRGSAALNLPRSRSAIRYVRSAAVAAGRRVICNSGAVDSSFYLGFSFYRKLQVHSSVTKARKLDRGAVYVLLSLPFGRGEGNALLGRLTGPFNPPRENSDCRGAIAPILWIFNTVSAGTRVAIARGDSYISEQHFRGNYTDRPIRLDTGAGSS